MNLPHKTAFGFYDFSWRIALPWLKLNQRLAEGYQQRAWQDKLPDRADLWIQAASVGESFLALEVIKALATRKPIRILLTSNTCQGIEILKKELTNSFKGKPRIQTTVRYFPFDRPSIMAQAVAVIRPKLMVLLETEIWPGLLHALKTQGCKIIIINGRITEKSLQRYNFWPSFWRALRPDKVLAISSADADRFRQLFGPDGIEEMTNIKFDRIIHQELFTDDHNRIKSILTPGRPFIVLASVRRKEETQVINIIKEISRNRPQTITGLFPRHLHRLAYWQQTITQLELPCVLRSTLAGPAASGTVILWDTFGELMSAYRLARSAFVGGSLAPLGGQNFLEALVSGVIPVIGPSWENFAWVGNEIFDAGLLRVAQNWRQVAALIQQDIDEPQPQNEVIKAALQFFERRRGGANQACRQIEAMLFGK